MRSRVFAVTMAGLLMAFPALAKHKDKVMPTYILSARTVAVIVDPSAGIDPDDPRANEVAQKDVATALMNWGRFQPVMSPEGADLVIVVRRGHGRLVDETIPDSRQNNRAGVVNPTEDGIGLGGQRSSQAPLGTPDGTTRYPPGQSPQSQIPQPQTEIGGAEDSFVVFDGKTARPLDGTPGWQYMAQDGLHPHNVPAVEEFRKAVAAGDKAAAAAATKKP